VERCGTGSTTEDDATSLLEDTVTVGRGVCDAAVTGWPAFAASAEPVTLAVLTVTADIRSNRSNISDDMLDKLDAAVPATAGIEFIDRFDSCSFTLCFVRRCSHISSSKYSPANTNK